MVDSHVTSGKSADDGLQVDTDDQNRSLMSAIAELIRASWSPTQVPEPKVDPDLDALPVLERIAEVCRYKAQQLEYMLSNRGGLREWFRLSVVLALALAIPAIIIVPVVTAILGSFVTWSAFILQTAINVFYILLVLIAIVVTVLAFEYLLKAYLKHRKAQANAEKRKRY